MRPLLGPAGRPFTDEQAEAIRRRDGSLLLYANAGSGKTSVLVERFVRSVLEDGVAPGRILAITFTEKAAGELRARVRERFLELGEREAARETEAAWVSTIHGFCARVLRSHAIAAGLDPAFTVLDDALARDLRAEAWDEAFGRWLDGDEGALDLAAAYGADRLRAAVGGAHDALRSGGATRPSLPATRHTPEVAPLRDALAAARDAAARELASTGDGVQLRRARAALDRCEELLRGLAPDEMPAATDLAAARFGGRARALAGETCAAYLAAHDAYATACRDRAAAAAVGRLDALLGHYADAYADAKRRRSSLDFDDLELAARDLLAGAPALRDAYAGRFDRVMVDELQDSNPLQLELFDLLDRDDLFLVGDENQSIYGFRHADVSVLRRRRDALAATGRVASLATNFRTRGPILDALNAAFAPRFGDGFVPLREGREPPPASGPLVEMLLTDREGWGDAEPPLDLGELPRAAAWRHAEARMLAQRVRDLVDAGDARPQEVVVLVRAMGDLPVYERALEDQGLLTLAVGGRGYWGRQVVRDLCAWLGALTNPRDETALYGVLASPLVGLSSDGLAHVARTGQGRAWRAIEAAFAASTGAPDGGDAAGGLAARLGPEDRRRLGAFRMRFAAERALAPRLGLDDLLRRAVTATDYELHVLSLDGGAQRMANVHKLLRLAAEFERDRGRDVRGLLDLATAELEAEAREPDAPVELGDVKAVRLMTIHAAKGLEFGVVCVADLGRRGAADNDDLLVDGERVGLRLVGLDGSSEPALGLEDLRRRARDEAAREEERIFYVALTRARERLILSGGVQVDAWPAPGPGAPPLSWLGPALVPGVDAGLLSTQQPERDVGGVRCRLNRPATVGRVLRPESLAPAGARLPVARAPAPRPPQPEPAGPAPVPATLSYSALAAWNACGYRFYLQRVLRLPDEPVEVSRQVVAGGGTDDSAGAQPPPAVDPRVRGTIVHALLEELDVTAAPDDAGVRKRAADLGADLGVALPEEQAADVAALIAAFTASPLHARVGRLHGVRREHGFAFALRDTLLTGVLDVMGEDEDGRVLVVDYKSDRLEPDADLERLVREGYGVQRRVYALAALRAGAPAVEVAHVFLERAGEPAIATFTAADAPRLEAEVLELAAGVLHGRFPVTDRPHRDLCLTCPGRRALCSHPEEVTLRETPAPPVAAPA